jgi:DNA end-binding protein Ku
VMSRDELEALDPKKTKAIEIEDFVDLDEIDPIYFNQPYYIGPAQGAERAYALLAQAMSEQRKVAIARFVMRNKESLAAIRANSDGSVLTLATMRFADEVVPTDQLDDVLGGTSDVEPRKREIDMAKALIDSLSSDFDPTSYKDEYREELLKLIERKASGEKIVSADSEAPKPTKAPDLMAALEESLAAIKGEELSGGAERESKPSKPKAKSSSSSSKSSGSKSAASKSKSTSKAKSKSKPKA